MSAGNTTRISILSEHTIKVAQHDHSKQNDTLSGNRHAGRFKQTLADFNRCRCKTLVNALKLRFKAKLLPKDVSE